MSTTAADDQKKLFRKFRIGLFSAMGAVVILMIVFAFLVAQNLPPLNEIENPELDLSTQIYTADGELIGSFYGMENRIHIGLEDMSEPVSQALIATEDVRFYAHHGVDPRSFPAIIKYVITHFRMRGGSTITMQLARNLYDQVGKDRSIYRKIKEMIVSFVLEKKFTKEEILEGYLNTTSFYGNTYGIEMGARTLFGKPASKLELHEAALMIGLLQNPTYHNPRRHPERATERRNTVIDQMKKYRFISNRKAKKAKAMPLGINFSPIGTYTGIAPYFKKQVKDWLIKWCEENGSDPYKDGLKVYTTLDSRLQKYAEEAVAEHLPEHQAKLEGELKKYGNPWEKNPKIMDRAISRTGRYRKAKQSGMSRAEIATAFRKKQKMRIWDWSGWSDTTMTPRDSVIHYLKFLETGLMAMNPSNGQIKAWVGRDQF